MFRRSDFLICLDVTENLFYKLPKVWRQENTVYLILRKSTQKILPTYAIAWLFCFKISYFLLLRRETRLELSILCSLVFVSWFYLLVYLFACLF